MSASTIFIAMAFIAGFLYLSVREISRKRGSKRNDDARKNDESRRKNELKEKIETGNNAADFSASVDLLHDLAD